MDARETRIAAGELETITDPAGVEVTMLGAAGYIDLRSTESPSPEAS